MLKKNLYCIVLAGGRGTRLWPFSRDDFPKQFLSTGQGESLLLGTLRRASGIVCPQNILVVLAEKHIPLMEHEMRVADFSQKVRIVSEPEGRNTAAAVLLGTLEVALEDRDAVVIVFPSDHLTEDGKNFHDHMTEAVSLARDGYVVCFGITPSGPETGYGYIEGGEPVGGSGLKVRRFVEKPDAATAEQYISSGNFFWNSGMFVFRAQTMIEQFEVCCPEVYGPLFDAFYKNTLKDVYSDIPSTPVDRAVMERISCAAVIPSSFIWSDVGSWRLFYDFFPKDHEGNVTQGNVFLKDTKDSLVKSGHRTVCVNGLSGVAVIETRDTVFVSDIDQSDKAGMFAEKFREKVGRDEYRYPWGKREQIEKSDRFCVTKTTVFPGSSCEVRNLSSFSLRLMVLSGKALVTHNRKREKLLTGDELVVEDAVGCVVENTGEEFLVIFEILFHRD